VAEYNSHLFRAGKWGLWRDQDGIFTGRVIAADHEGKLKIESVDTKTRVYSFKEVEVIL
jgi:hypothetical protein